MVDDNELAQRDSEAPHELQRSWVTFLASDANEVAVGAATAGLLYGAAKIAGKIRKPPPPPPPGDGGKE
jgi:hypothetical protein